MTADFYLSV